jgi:V/A-type H+/Na+-transporting ATPase subunit E
MDELRSSDALEREIRDDSRKKAERLFKQADEATRQYLETSAAAGETEIEALKKEYARRTEAYRAEVMSRLPMDRKRKRIEWAQRRLESAVASELSRLDPESLLSLLIRPLKEALAHFAGKKYSVSLTGIPRDAALAALSRALPGFSPSFLKEETGAEPRGIVMSAEDGRASFSMNEDSIREDLLDGTRRELVEALLGKVDEL